ncbi:hypothetical protein SDD30_14260 [Moorella naiadis]|uniref:hypothetical protein n=1 Tax=Moorella naiadis (nom. illeg.) TaxID=3093670 RepID=UPI003D9CAB6A
MPAKFWRVFFITCSSLATAALSLWTVDPDLFWHLKAGEWIAVHKTIPAADIYSWSSYGQPWTDHQWLWELTNYLLYRKAGYPGLWLVTLLSGILIGMLIWLGTEKRSGVTGAAAGGLAPFLLYGWLRPWPQEWVYALFAGYLYISLRRDWGRKEILSLALIAALWANIHSSAVMLPLLILLEAGWEAVVLRVKEGLPARLLAALSCGIATLFTPHGAGLWAYAVKEGLLTNAYRQHIAEWMPFVFGFHEQSFIFFASLAIILAAAWQGRKRDIVMARAIFFWVLALNSRIYTPYAVLSTALLFGTLECKFSLTTIKLLAIQFIAVGIFILTLKGIPMNLQEAAAKDNYPVKAVEVIKERGYDKVYNEYGWGGYLIWSGIPVYIDGRADLYSHGGIFDGYMNLIQGDKPAGEAIEDTGAKTALVAVNDIRDAVLKEAPGWVEVYRDKTAAIFRVKD